MSLFGPIDWKHVIEMIIILLIAIDIHELAHALVATSLGDQTPRRWGEVSLNPFVHMDQIGIMLLLLTSISSYGFTYGRTHVTPANLKFGPQRGNALVAVAGPLSNLALAIISGIVLSLYANGTLNLSVDVVNFVYLNALLNVILFVFNLLPIPPLDGFTILGGFLSARQMYSLAPLQQWGPLILLLVFITEPQFHIISSTINPVVNQVFHTICSVCV